MSLSDEELAARTKCIMDKSAELNKRCDRLSMRSVLAQQNAEALHDRHERVPAVPPRKGQILIVDDNADTCEILSIVLKAADYSVRVVPDKQTALDTLRDQPASTILMDHKTSGLDSQGFIRDVKAAHPQSCVILMSGMPDLLDLAASLHLQLTVAKPLDFELLLGTVEQAEWG